MNVVKQEWALLVKVDYFDGTDFKTAIYKIIKQSHLYFDRLDRAEPFDLTVVPNGRTR